MMNLTRLNRYFLISKINESLLNWQHIESQCFRVCLEHQPFRIFKCKLGADFVPCFYPCIPFEFQENRVIN